MTRNLVINAPPKGRTIAVVGDVYRFLATGEEVLLRIEEHQRAALAVLRRLDGHLHRNPLVDLGSCFRCRQMAWQCPLMVVQGVSKSFLPYYPTMKGGLSSSESAN